MFQNTCIGFIFWYCFLVCCKFVFFIFLTFFTFFSSSLLFLFYRCVSPAESNTEETLSTLRYANAAKNIQNTAIVNRSPHEVALLRAAVKLDAMTFEYVRHAHGKQRGETKDDEVHHLISTSDSIKNNIAAILSTALENRDDLTSNTNKHHHSNTSSHNTAQHHHHSSTSNNRPRTKSYDTSASSQTNHHTTRSTKGRRGRSNSKNMSNNKTVPSKMLSSSSSSSTAHAAAASVPVVLTEEEKRNSKELISFVEQAEKKIQEEYLLIISDLEKEQVSDNKDEEEKRKEADIDLKKKELAWHEIKNILEKFPKVQAEQIKLKEEVDRIEKERLQLGKKSLFCNYYILVTRVLYRW